MGKIYVEIDDDLERKFRKKVLERFGARKGSLSMAVKEAIQLWLKDR